MTQHWERLGWKSMRTLVISGASSGLGQTIVKALMDDFDLVVTIGRSTPYLGHTPSKHMHITMDFKNPTECLKAIEKNVTVCDVLINCAGYMPLEDFLDYSLEQEMDILNINYTTHYLMMKHFMAGAVKVGRKLDIINIASGCGVKPDCDTPNYAACKSGIIALTKGLATYRPELIRVNSISPGFFNTNLVPGDAPQELLDAVVPMKREADPREIMPVIRCILNSPFMTGSNIVIDGGQVCR